LNIKYSSIVTMINNAVSGTDSTDALNNISTQLLNQSATCCIFMHGGTNDSYYSVSQITYASNLQSYINQAKASNIHIIFVTCPVAANETQATDNDFPNWRDNTLLVQYIATMKSVASANNIYVVDWYNTLLLDSSWISDYIVDGVHVNIAVKTILVNQLVENIPVYIFGSTSHSNPFPCFFPGT